MRGRLQGGSLAGFIIIGAFLALIVIGGLYGLNRYNAEQAADEIAVENSDSAETPAGSEEQNSDDDGAVEPEQQELPGSTDQQSSDEPTPTDTETETSEPQSSDELPKTGSADIALALLGVFALSFAVTHYARSRN